MEDSEIVGLFFDRNEKAISETTLKYRHLCKKNAMNILGNLEDTEECVNDSMLVLWNLIPPNNPQSLSAFLCKIVRNQALKRHEYNSAQKRNPLLSQSIEELEGVVADKGDCLEDTTDAEHLGKLISDFLRTEKPDSRNVFIRRYWFFDSVQDISKSFGFSQSKVKSMLFHTRQKLKDYLLKEGIEV